MNGQDPIKVLLIEDDSDDYRLIAKQLRNQNRGVIVDWADTISAAADKLARIPIDIILTDLSLPDSKGLGTVSRLKAMCQSLPIIVLTALDDECMEQDLLEAGAQDYLVKGELNGRATLRAILHAIQRQEMQNELRSLLAEREQDQLMMRQQAELLKNKNRRLRRLYRTAQEFVDNVSHDFRTPLTVIKDYVAIIREGMVGHINDEQQSMLDKVAVRTDDLNNMVDDLLDVSKLEAGLLGVRRRNTPVGDIVERAESMLRQRAQVKNVCLTVECEPNLPAVYCDADMIGRVVTNLAVNAIKFSRDAGQVRMWARDDPAGRQVVIGITDNGPGIDSESLSSIFERFRQVDGNMKSTVKGFGLGLSIAQQLCNINLGKLSVESRVGEGSTFSFTIPIADPLEVLSRWQGTQVSSRESLQLMEIAIAREASSASADEFDRFLNCLLRKHDLLFRVSAYKWLLMMASPPRGTDRWSSRVKEEFQRHNRNRPMGPLPDYRAEVRGVWPALGDRENLLDEFRVILRRSLESAVVGASSR